MKDIITKLKNPDIEYRPEVRWWLAEGFHTDQTLKNDIQMLYDSGFGAVEFLAMQDAGVDSAKYGWGSEEWVHDSQLIIRETTEKGMGVSTTSGTNWANANLTTITPDDKAASKELDFVSTVLAPGQTWSGRIPECEITMQNVHIQELVAVICGKRVGRRGQSVILDEKSMQILTEQVCDGYLEYTAPADGEYELMFFWMHGTGQTAEPSVSVSYTVNYFDRYGCDALTDYWSKEVLTEELQSIIKKNDRAMMYMDSLELDNKGKGGLFWGYHILEEFSKRRGYNLTPYIPFCTKYHRGIGIDMMPPVYRYEMQDAELAWKIRNDLYQTFTDLYMDNMLKPLQAWLHENGMQLRAEISYGMPFEISLPGKYVDGVETESLEFASQIDSYRGLAGTAHMYGKLFSSETGANLYNYMLPLNFYTQIIYTQFAAGVAKTVLHGYSSIAGSEDATYWPGHEGMLPVFAERFGSRQPASVHYPDWTGMIARYQMLLRQGKPRVDLGILRLDYYYNNMFMQYGPEKETYEKKFLRANEGIYWQDMSLQNSGYTYEYFAPQILEEEFVVFDGKELFPDGPGYQALLLYQEGLPLEAARKLLKLAKEGLPIILVDGVTETIHVGRQVSHERAASMTPFYDKQDEMLKKVIQEMEACPSVIRVSSREEISGILKSMGIYPRAAFREPNKKILTAYRQTEETDYIFFYHYMYTEKESFCFCTDIQAQGTPVLLDCWEGCIKEIACFEEAEGTTGLTLEMKPGQALMVGIEKKQKQDRHLVSLDKGAAVRKDSRLYLQAFETGDYHAAFGNGDKTCIHAEVMEDMKLEKWQLHMESWMAGDKKEIIEDRGLDLLTKEVYYETDKKNIEVVLDVLRPWKDIAEIGPEVSGIGRYKTELVLPESWTNEMGAVLCMESVCGNTAAVYVNGRKTQGFDFNRLSMDISEYLHPGKNELCIEVSSTLQNRLLADGYYEEHVYSMAPPPSEDDENQELGLPKAHVDEYGLMGPVFLKTYRLYSLDER